MREMPDSAYFYFRQALELSEKGISSTLGRKTLLVTYKRFKGVDKTKVSSSSKKGEGISFI